MFVHSNSARPANNPTEFERERGGCRVLRRAARSLATAAGSQSTGGSWSETPSTPTWPRAGLNGFPLGVTDVQRQHDNCPGSLSADALEKIDDLLSLVAVSAGFSEQVASKVHHHAFAGCVAGHGDAVAASKLEEVLVAEEP